VGLKLLKREESVSPFWDTLFQESHRVNINCTDRIPTFLPDGNSKLAPEISAANEYMLQYNYET
jgi:hypothetical protein